MRTETLSGAIHLPDGTAVRGRGLRRGLPTGPLPEYGLYLGSPRARRKQAQLAERAWSYDWIDWPDFRLPRDRDAAVRLIHRLHERARSGARVEVACGGGVGRTGTVLACLAILADVPADEAVAWVRRHHHHHAVETPWQRKWVAAFPSPATRRVDQ